MVLAGWLSPVMAQTAPADAAPVPIHQEVPDYPLMALAKARNGEVIVEFVVTITGTVSGAHAVRSTDPVFEAPAEAAVSHWVFRPGLKAGRPVNTRMQVPIIFRPTEEQLAALQGRSQVADGPPPAGRGEAAVPGLPADMVPVFPYRALLENRRIAVAGWVTFDEQGEPAAPAWDPVPPPEFAGAVEAMLDAWSGTKIDGRPLTGKRWLRLRFDAHDGQVRVSDAGAAILKRLRTEGENAVFVRADELDAKLQPVSQPDPVFPRGLRGKAQQGEAEVEFFVDPTGRAQLPHVLTASDPAFGYAACQAVAGWQYHPPRCDGHAATVRLVTTLIFKAPSQPAD